MVSVVSFRFFLKFSSPKTWGVQFDSRCVARTYISWAGSTTTQFFALKTEKIFVFGSFDILPMLVPSWEDKISCYQGLFDDFPPVWWKELG